MAEFYADWSRMLSLSEELETSSKNIKNLVAQTGTIKNNLIIGNEVHQIQGALDKSNQKFERIINLLRKSSDVMEQAANTYKNTEKVLMGGSVSTENSRNPVIPIDWNESFRWFDNYFRRFIHVPTGSSGVGACFGVLAYLLGGTDVSGSFRGELLGGSFDSYSKMTYGIDPETGKKDVEFVSGFDAEGHLIGGSLEGNIGLLSGTVDAAILTGTLSGRCGASLFKDGKLAPALEAELKAKVAVASGSAGTQFGTEKNNAHVSAGGTLLGAEAEISGGAGVITYEDDKGNTTTEFGVQGKVGAEAYLAEGSVSGGFTIFGIDINAKVSGKAGGVGASAEGRFTTGGVQGEIGAGLGLGGSIELSVDWSDFSIGDFSLEDIWPW